MLFRNIFYLIQFTLLFHLYSSTSSQIPQSKYLKIPFKRSIYLNDQNPFSLMESLFYSRIFVELKIGSSISIFPVSIKLQHLPTYIISKNISENIKKNNEIENKKELNGKNNNNSKNIIKNFLHESDGDKSQYVNEKENDNSIEINDKSNFNNENKEQIEISNEEVLKMEYNVCKNKNDLYDDTQSSIEVPLEHRKLIKNISYEDFNEGIEYNDTFILLDNEISNSLSEEFRKSYRNREIIFPHSRFTYNIPKYLDIVSSIKNNKYISPNISFILANGTNLNFCDLFFPGSIGLKPEKYNDKNNDFSFTNQLYHNKLISEKIFSIKYTNNIIDYNYSYSKAFNKDEGYLLIGTDPSTIFPEIYQNPKKITKHMYDNDKAEWRINFDEIYVGKTKIMYSNLAYLYYELGVIIGNVNAVNELKKQFFNDFLIQNLCFENEMNIDKFDGYEIKGPENKINGIYNFIYCKKEIDLSKFPPIKFNYLTRNKIEFELNKDDLFYETNDYIYFLIVYNKNNYHWNFGTPFFKKYQPVFHYQDQAITFYDTKKNQEESDDKIIKNKDKINLFNIVCYSTLIVTIIILILMIVKLKYLLPRKKKANELEEEFSYKNDKINEEFV